MALGPGRKDGGVDLRIWPDQESRDGPPLILIQCKRYSNGKLVEVEYIKSLWTDVVYENADGGLLATTACVSPAGKRIAEARKWPMSFVEASMVKRWARSMWRYPWRGRGKTVGVGVYLLPPVYP